MGNVYCGEKNNPPEVIDRNELIATIAFVPYKWANDESYIAWRDLKTRGARNWVLNEWGEVELVTQRIQ